MAQPGIGTRLHGLAKHPDPEAEIMGPDPHQAKALPLLIWRSAVLNAKSYQGHVMRTRQKATGNLEQCCTSEHCV